MEKTHARISQKKSIERYHWDIPWIAETISGGFLNDYLYRFAKKRKGIHGDLFGWILGK